jgi:hypothetical protein
MKPGRNDPCPCGSGRKYKHCCLLKAEALAPDELAWRRVRRAIDPLPDELLREAGRHFGATGLQEAWDEFNLWSFEDDAFDAESPYVTLFFAWYLHDWLPDPEETELPEAVRGQTVAQAYLARTGHRLDPLARSYVEACCATPFSFHEVLDCRPGHGLRLRDVLLGTEREVTERTASRTLQVGDLIFAKVVPIEGMHLIEGLGPAAVPPADKLRVIKLRKRIGSAGDLFAAELLRDWDIELRELYLSIARRRLDPQLPELRNTDGDPLEMHTLIFDLDAPEVAVERLADLAAGVYEPDVVRDAEGRLVRAELVWARRGNATHTHWDNTTLGHLCIDGSRLTAEVNSARRAAALRTLIDERLGDTAKARPLIVQSVQSMLERERAPREQAQRQQRENAELAAQPEVQAVLREAVRDHYRAWVDAKLPALDNRTPREAVRDPDGREAVVALIDQIERDGPKLTPPLDPDIVRELRETLGLQRR